MSSVSNQEECAMQPAPPLYKKGQVRCQAFGFPVTEDDLHTWAEKHNTCAGKKDNVRRHAAWRAICSRLPPNHRRITTIRDAMPSRSVSLCFVIGSNLNAKDMGLTQDVELIKLLSDAIDMGKRPGWFYMCQA
ncbi:hypothetical protein BYT27DRAFT_6738016 [Phlegmacium glaucopus]|nr:hypothetical protein BYT27DRAFT_6738016 [Phlegmacium glaucopus]